MTSTTSFSSLKSFNENDEENNNSISSKNITGNSLDENTISLIGQKRHDLYKDPILDSSSISDHKVERNELNEFVSKSQVTPIDYDKSILALNKYRNISSKINSKDQKINRNLGKKSTSNLTKSCNNLQILNKNRSFTASSGNLVWTEWVIKKAKESILQNEVRIRKKHELMEEKKKKNEQNKTKRVLFDEKFREWSQKYDEEILEKQIEIEKKLKEEILIKEKKKAEIKLKAEENYLEWQQKKRKDKKIKEEEEKLAKEILDSQKKAKEERAKVAYNNWLKISKNRPKSSCQSYAIACGRTIGYYDWGCCSQPSYINPQKWIFE